MDELDHYREHGRITDPGAMRHLFEGLPAEPATLVRCSGAGRAGSWPARRVGVSGAAQRACGPA